MSVKHDRAQPDSVPRAFLIAAGLLVAFTMVLVGGYRLLDGRDASARLAQAVAVTELRFEDRPDGSIAVLAGANGRQVQTVDPGTNGFLRGTLRALARERRQNEATAAEPFRLVRRADGSLTLDDPATGRSVNLNAFGPANSGVFAALLTSGSKQQ
jgi:putative photosynthetic complex assembly protein